MKDGLKRLRIWQEAQNLTQIIHESCKAMRGNFVLKDQIDRSSQAVADAISEMYGVYHYTNKIKILYDARREALETINHVEKFRRRSLWNLNFCAEIEKRYDEEIKGINGFIRYLAKEREKHSAQK